MVDYTYGIPGSVGGLMMIRDTGSQVQFFIKSGNTIAWDYNLYWNGVVNGVNVGGMARYEAGGNWLMVGAWNVSYNQTVTFRKTSDSESQGLGGTGGFSTPINRTTVPPAPKPLGIDQITGYSFRYRFSSQGNGGSSILQWQIGYGTNANSPQAFMTSSGTSTINALDRNTNYYVWSRGRNALGWGPWSARSAVKTHNIPWPPISYTPTDIEHQAMTFKIKDNGNGGMPIVAREFQVWSEPDFDGAPIYSFANRIKLPWPSQDWWATTKPPNAEAGVRDLLPGIRYYWRARVANSVGPSPWSTVRSAKTLPGVYINDEGIIKLGIPYVKAKGKWRPGVFYGKRGTKWFISGIE